MKWFRSMSMLYRLMLSLLLVALIPLALLSLFFVRYNLQGVKRNIEHLNEYQLRQIENAFNLQFQQHLTVAQKIQSDPQLNTHWLGVSQPRRMEGLKAFRLHTMGMTQQEQPFLYLRASDLFYSNTGALSTEALIQRQFLFTEESAARFREWLLSARMPSVMTFDSQQGRKVLFQYPFPDMQRCLLLAMDSDAVMAPFLALVSDVDGWVYIQDGNGQPIVCNSTDAETLRQLRDGLQGESGATLRLGEQNHTLLYTRSRLNGWVFAVALPESLYNIDFLRSSSTLWIITLLVMLLCIVGCIALAHGHYRPLRQIVRDIGRDKGHTGNEYERIRASIHDTQDAAERLQKKLALQAPYAKERVLELLLFSDIRKQDFEELQHKFDLGFSAAYYFVMAVELSHCGQAATRLRFRQLVNDIADRPPCSTPCSIRCIERIHAKDLLLVVSTDHPEARAAIVQGIADALERIREIDAEAVYLYGAADGGDQPWALRQSSQEACAVLEHNRSHGNTVVLSFQNIPVDEGAFDYPVQATMLYLQQLKQGDAVGMTETLESICKTIDKNQDSLFVRKYVCCDIINALVKISKEVAPDSFLEDISALIAFQTLPEFQERMLALSRKLCELINGRKRDHSRLLKDRILDYINDNFHDPDLGLESLGEHFDLSPAYISRFIREQTGLNIKDFISRVRIEESKRLLVETDLPINEIVERVGYYNASSFIRKFRNTENQTPGEYRGNAREA